MVGCLVASHFRSLDTVTIATSYNTESISRHWQIYLACVYQGEKVYEILKSASGLSSWK